jgi:hypothetical protein
VLGDASRCMGKTVVGRGGCENGGHTEIARCAAAEVAKETGRGDEDGDQHEDNEGCDPRGDLVADDAGGGVLAKFVHALTTAAWDVSGTHVK